MVSETAGHQGSGEGGLGAALCAGAARHGSTALVFHGPRGTESTNLRSVHDRALRVAAGLAALGVGPGDVVALQLTSRLESAIAHAAVLLRGAVVLPIVPIYGLREVGFVLRQSGAAALIAFAGRAGEVLAMRDGLPRLRQVIAVADGSGAVQGAASWESLQEHAPLGPLEPADPDDVCVLVYTSGTTADPKGVQHTHRSMLAELTTMAEMRAGYGADFGYLDAFPPGHVAGLNVLLRALIYGVPTVFMERWDAETALDIVHRHGVTASAGVPFHLAALLDAAERTGRGVGGLREYLVGAASVPPVLVERAERTGIAAYRAYGSSEHPTISSGGVDDPRDKRATTDGRPMPGTQVRIVDAKGRDLPPGREGEILSRGPELFAGYRDPALNAEAFTTDGWLRTGDVGRMDEDGYLTITDRLKDIIVRGGEKISSKEVEDLLSVHPAVAETVAVAEPDERYGERVCAFVVLRQGCHLDLDAVRDHFAAHGAARQKTPERLMVVEALPRTAAGKVRKHELRGILQSNQNR
ncbi:Acyl-CoA synthetase (AMP-forming)/AMP-acid ligase II [Thermomonospora echinospora]|uniref:Acyl-CoA synthetase (AMP-forming)/AMP-acid ligase II n=1 Tax=Thermomonospora echinospora TaxID=1992 RepID=A0A1H6DTM3_9ACTN|nr:AMP-binding protein [Thermomonospora echinospora]SEG88697.1 Acyl-CoA synthetase (AMP-forming)/AMP-acid ligase II [Thermomonospora echinospora]